MANVTRFTLSASDAYPLGASHFEATPPLRGVVIIHSASAVSQRLYQAFALFLAEHGFHVLSYDYRGIGRSRPEQLERLEVRMQDWAELDADSVTQWARQRWPDLPLLAIGHSFGGHAIGLGDASRHLSAAVLIACNASCLRFISSPWLRLRAWMLFKLVFPLLSRINGYVPCRRLGISEDVPEGVARQCSRWTSLPRYFFDDPELNAEVRFARVTLPLLVVGLDDDPYASSDSIDLLSAYFTDASVKRLQLSPRVLGSGVLGHLEGFRRRHRDTLWPLICSWLVERAPSTQTGSVSAAPWTVIADEAGPHGANVQGAGG
ncbi:alpha/beta fold hydrolase [Halomonas sp. DN3]|uniref:alpha/beta hydrolase family protein n=1 Tax=Halomonas sp. DN3 TaxID=2953657 RepID=UPI0020A1A023|nr:alpha/beta fold hydrolase [Halomonas sp. DN3]USZ50290.1 alpha/beta fold hydrolase [Halomonas sp. DN3]